VKSTSSVSGVPASSRRGSWTGIQEKVFFFGENHGCLSRIPGREKRRKKSSQTGMAGRAMGDRRSRSSQSRERAMPRSFIPAAVPVLFLR